MEEGGGRVDVRVRERDVRMEAEKPRAGRLGETQSHLLALKMEEEPRAEE